MNDLLKWQWQRALDERMTYYRKAYNGSLRLVGPSKLRRDFHVIVYCEQGIGDTLQLLRYVPHIPFDRITLHCDSSLHRLIQSQWNVGVLDKSDSSVPQHDFHILSMDLPYVVGPVPAEPYIKVDSQIEEVAAMENTIGIAWEGNPGHLNNHNRCCHLEYFKQLNGTLFCLQNATYREDLQTDIDLYSVPLNDFIDTAALINSVGYVVTVDTSILHLAAAMGKKTYGLLSVECDPRWGAKATNSPWYPSLTLLRQQQPGDWSAAFVQLVQAEQT